MPSELEIRKAQRELLFDYLEIRRASKEKNPVLESKISRLRSGMSDEDKAIVEKEFAQIYG